MQVQGTMFFRLRGYHRYITVTLWFVSRMRWFRSYRFNTTHQLVVTQHNRNMAESYTAEDQFSILESLLRSDEIIRPTSPTYHSSIQTWAAQKQLKPRIVLRPTSIDSLSKTIAHLYFTKLDFAIYGHGFMSASAKDVLVNMSAFDGFHFDRHSELATIGAGQTWSDVYRKLGDVAPNYGSKK